MDSLLAHFTSTSPVAAWPIHGLGWRPPPRVSLDRSNSRWDTRRCNACGLWHLRLLPTTHLEPNTEILVEQDRPILHHPEDPQTIVSFDGSAIRDRTTGTHTGGAAAVLLTKTSDGFYRLKGQAVAHLGTEVSALEAELRAAVLAAQLVTRASHLCDLSRLTVQGDNPTVLAALETRRSFRVETLATLQHAALELFSSFVAPCTWQLIQSTSNDAHTLAQIGAKHPARNPGGRPNTEWTRFSIAPGST